MFFSWLLNAQCFELHVVYRVIHEFVEMSCLQITAHQRCRDFTSICHLQFASSVQCTAQVQSFRTHKSSTTLTACSSSYLGVKLPRIAKSLSIDGASGFRKSTPVCLFGGKGKSENADEVKVFLKFWHSVYEFSR